MWLTERIKNHLKTLKIHRGQVCHATWPFRPIYFTRVYHMSQPPIKHGVYTLKIPKLEMNP